MDDNIQNPEAVEKQRKRLKFRRYILMVTIPIVIIGATIILKHGKHNEKMMVPKSQSLEDIEKFIETNPTDKQVLFNLGDAYKKTNLLNQAIEAYSRVLSLQPDFPNAYYERGYCYSKMGLFPQARADMDGSIRYQPDHGPSYLLRGRCFEALGDLKSACIEWQKAYELGNKEAESFILEKCRN